jgi:hypothetical protein
MGRWLRQKTRSRRLGARQREARPTAQGIADPRSRRCGFGIVATVNFRPRTAPVRPSRRISRATVHWATA